MTDELAGRTDGRRGESNEGAAAFWSATPGDDIRSGTQRGSLPLMLMSTLSSALFPFLADLLE